MELFTAGDRSQMATIKEWINESDVYMLILGGRYGSIEPTTGISYTELEYDYSIEQGKPVFAVVIKEEALEAKVKTGGTLFMEKENPKELALFRKKALGNISSFFEDCKDIKLCVYESMADFSANRDLKGWVSGDEVIDTKPLFDEIKKISDENQSLKEELKKITMLVPVQVAPQETNKHNELKEILEEIQIKIPAKLNSDGKDTEMDLLSIFTSTKDTLISGVTNSIRASDLNSFLYYNICPKLQIHGLITNEKVAGAQFRRCSVTSEGNRFLAFLEKEDLRKKKEISKKSIKEPTVTEQPKPKPKPKNPKPTKS